MEPFQRRAFPAYAPRILDLVDAMLDEWRAGEMREHPGRNESTLAAHHSSILFGFNQPDLVFELGRMIEQWGAMNDGLGLAALVPAVRFQRTLRRTAGLRFAARSKVVGHDRPPPQRSQRRRCAFDPAPRPAPGSGLSDKALFGQTTLLLGTAHLTTAHTLTWAFFLLAQHPEIGERLSREVDPMSRAELQANPEAETLRSPTGC